MKKIICVILAAALALSATACGNKVKPDSSSTAPSTQNQETPKDDPILTGEKPELKILSMYQTYNYEEQPSYKLLEELTGYKTKWFMLPAENSDQKLMLEISSGTDYDVLLRMSGTGYSQLSNQGALIDLTDILNKYGQNILKEVTDYAWQSTTKDDGKINGIPHESGYVAKDKPYGMLSGGIGVRSDMLEELGGKVPETLDEFTQFLKDAKAKFGKTPLTANSKSHFDATIMSAFGLGVAEWYDVNGVYTHRIKHPAITDYLKYMQMLYKEGLLDNDAPINTNAAAKEKFASKNATAIAPLMFWDIPSMLKALNTSNPDCKVKFITGLAKDANTKPVSYVGKGAQFFTCISQHSKNPEHAINWLNILSTDENYRKVYIGEEGVSYEVKDGNYYPIFPAFNDYQNGDKFTGFIRPDQIHTMWQARARKTPEMAEAFEDMNKRCDKFDVFYTIESAGKTSPKVQEFASSLATYFSDSFLKAVVEGTDAEKAIADMRAHWDKNGGPEMEKAMQEYYEANKKFAE